MAKVTAVLALLTTLMAAEGFGQVRGEQNVVHVDTVAGRAALRVFSRLITKDNYRDMGFESEAEIRSATLGAQLPEFMIRLDELRTFQPGQNPAPLLHASGRVTWLVLVGGQTRSSLTLSRREGEWAAVSYGSPRQARAVDSVRALLTARPGGGGVQYFEVRVAALNVVFLGSWQGGQLFLTPLRSDARFRFQSGSTLPAAQALLQMVQAAREHNGLPS